VRRVATAAVVLLLWPVTAQAQDPEDVAARVSQEIMSPFCDGVTLHDCPSGAADDLRRRIVGMARAGLSEDDIIETLESEYGDRIRATPGSAVSWIAPGLVVAAGVCLIAVLARRWTRRRLPQPKIRVSPGDRARVEEELSAHRGQR
jgi:cytochrome c-type biogenesis protein CcmH/NrfF